MYLRNGQPCDKNDVYSYGVVLLELITGRRAIQQKLSLLEWCKDFLHTEEHVMRHILPRVVDSRMNPLEVNFDQIFEVVKIARNCVSERQENRPTMQDVVAGLYNANCKEITTSSEFPSIEVVQNLNILLFTFLSCYVTLIILVDGDLIRSRYLPLQVPLNRFGSNGGGYDVGSLNNIIQHGNWYTRLLISQSKALVFILRTCRAMFLEICESTHP